MVNKYLKEKKYVYIFIFCFIFVFFGGLLRKNYNADTVYFTFLEDGGAYVWLQDARYISTIISVVLSWFGLSTTTNLSITVGVALLLCSVTCILLYELFSVFFDNKKYFIIPACMLCFCNCLYIESLLFTETAISFVLAYFFAVLATYMYGKRQYIWMVILLFCAVCTYQVAIPFFIMITLFYIYFANGKILSKKSFVQSFVVSFVALLIGVLNMFSITILEKMNLIVRKKNPGSGNWGDKIKAMWKSLTAIYRNADGILPAVYIPLLFSAIVLLFIFVYCYKEKNYNTMLYNFLLMICCHIVMYIIPMAMSSFRFPARMSFVFFVIQSMLLLSALDLENNREVIVWLGVGYLFLQFLFCSFIITNHFISNTLDKIYANMVVEVIEQYENETGQEVKYLAPHNDIDAPNSYNEVGYKAHEINERSLTIVPCSTVEMVTGRHFDKKEMPEDIYRKYFAGKNWNYFSAEEQIVFEGDTAYWCIF